MTAYEIQEEGGGSTTIEADSIDDALDRAREWLRSGKYDLPGTRLPARARAYVRELSAEGRVVYSEVVDVVIQEAR